MSVFKSHMSCLKKSSDKWKDNPFLTIFSINSIESFFTVKNNTNDKTQITMQNSYSIKSLSS